MNDLKNQAFYLALLTVLAAMVFLWFGFCIWIFRRLEKNHPEKYSSMGRPSLLLRNNLDNNWLFIKFLWRSEYSILNDQSLSRTCGLMKVFLAIYCVLFLFMLFTFFAGFGQP